MSGALLRYRIAAYVVGVFLVLLVFVAMPMKYLGDNPTPTAIIGTAHGWLYLGYLLLTFDLGRRAGWKLSRMIPVMLAGTVPLVSFYAERRVAAWVKADLAGASDGTTVDIEKKSTAATPS